MEYFEIKRETPIALYGLGSIGKDKCRVLIDSGYQVVSIIDKNAACLPQFCSIPVLDMKEFCRKFPVRKEIVIIICLNNGMQHEKVADSLASYGYDKILYIPMDEKRAFSYLSEMQQAYSNFLDNNFLLLDKIPVSIRRDNNTDAEIQIISSDSENITFLCEIEYLFSPDERTIREAAATEDIFKNALKKPEYVDKPIVMCKNYSNLYDYIMGKVPYPDLYMKYLGRDEKYNRELLKDRINLFQCYEQRYAANATLFYLQPAAAAWNPKGYFNICDGMHRAMFLYYVKNHFKIPIRTAKHSFDYFKRSYKESGCIYKSRELILQETLFDYFDVHNSSGTVIGGANNSAAIGIFERISKNITFYKNKQECLTSKKIFDYAFLHPSLPILDHWEIFTEIFCITPRIIMECSETVSIVSDSLPEEKIIQLGCVLGKDLKQTYLYLLER